MHTKHFTVIMPIGAVIGGLTLKKYELRIWRKKQFADPTRDIY